MLLQLLQSGKVYLQRCNDPTSISEHKQQTNPALQDLNFPPSPTLKSPLNLFDDTSLELKLVSTTNPSYQSVCTLDKVKSALERAEKDPIKKRSSSMWKSSMSTSPSYSSSSSSIKDVQEEENDERFNISPIVAGCPGCLSYVLIMKNNPKCPNCSLAIELPIAKKPRIDLNMTI